MHASISHRRKGCDLKGEAGEKERRGPTPSAGGKKEEPSFKSTNH